MRDLSSTDNRPGFLVLAAGSARRFGGNKLLTNLDDKPVIQHCLDTLLETKHPIAVVSNANDILAQNLLSNAPVMNIPYRPRCDALHGLGYSLAHGIEHTRHWNGWVICLADMPWIQAGTYTQTINALSHSAITRPIYSPTQQIGHPVGFDSHYRDQLLALTGDQGAISIVSRNKSTLSLIEVEDYGILLDIDLPSDLNRGP